MFKLVSSLTKGLWGVLTWIRSPKKEMAVTFFYSPLEY